MYRLLLALVFSNALILSPLVGQDSPSGDSAVEQINLPDWMPIDARGEWEYLYTDRLPELREALHNYEATQRGLNKEHAKGKENGVSESRLDSLRAEIALGVSLTQAKMDEIDTLEVRLGELTSFFQWPNPQHWAFHHGPSVLGILLVLFLGMRVISLVCRQILVRTKATGENSEAAEKQQRAETLVTVFRKSAIGFLLGFCFLALLGEFGIDTATLLAGVGLLGFALTWGSQSLVKDFLSGFFMLLEGQLAIGDFISINGKLSGTVENFTMRVTQLRDGSGVVHFIPNGSINSVSNQTHTFSKAVFTVGAGYREDPDHVTGILEKVLGEFAQDSEWSEQILEEPQVLGVDGLMESEVTYKIAVKTTPGKQWGARRELLKRIKIAFDRNDVEIPFPQRVHYTESTQPRSRTLDR